MDAHAAGGHAEVPISLTADALSNLLRPLMQQAIQAHREPRSCTDDDAGAASTSDADVEELLGGLKQYLAMQSSHGWEGAGVSLPEVDQQLLPLQQEVEAVMQSITGHRASVPAVITKALEQQLQHMRPVPAADVAGAADQVVAAGPAGGAAAEPRADTAQARQLHEALQAALNKLPALRARLEEMDARLQRNLAAVDATNGSGGARTPRTVERVLRSVAAGEVMGRGPTGGMGADVAGEEEEEEDEVDMTGAM